MSTDPWADGFPIYGPKQRPKDDPAAIDAVEHVLRRLKTPQRMAVLRRFCVACGQLRDDCRCWRSRGCRTPKPARPHTA